MLRNLNCSIIILLILMLSCSDSELSHESKIGDVSDALRVTLSSKIEEENYELNLLFSNSSKSDYLHVIEPDFELGNLKFVASCDGIILSEEVNSRRFVTQSGFEGRILGPGESFIISEKIAFDSTGLIRFQKSKQELRFFGQSSDKPVEIQIMVSVSAYASNFISGRCKRFNLESETRINAPSYWLLDSKNNGKSHPMVKPRKDTGSEFSLPPAPLPSQ